ncbi:TniQ protein [Streptomyces sp. Ncost-T6T-1]|uniref:TniQ family protein n=1 Tax=Streptomyces sp. Ncost-T6T-1 TaxID=1100828 RepID=UPI000805D7E5|nr:TniQ family protein [Streptomyces sp. Ncost-T6T-1]SBU96835.1 TniQ protein [Streptomyces sp. Ncost-T6T-1]
MTTPAFPAERLSYVVEPLPGEALDSWTEAYARELLVTAHDFLTFVGLPRAFTERMVIRLLPEEEEILTRVTGVDPTRLRGMTLEPLDGITVTLRPATRGLASPPHWRRHRASRFCPMCLADSGGRWQLAWRNPWAFACLQHHVLLVDDCPSGGHRPHPAGRHPAGVTAAGKCTMARRLPGTSAQARRPCGADLSGMLPEHIAVASMIITAQRYVDEAVRRATRCPGGMDELGEIFYLAWRALSALHDKDEPVPLPAERVLAELGGHVPDPLVGLSNETAHHVAVGTSLAMAIRNTTHPDSDTILAWIAHAYLHKERRTEIHDKLRTWRRACSVPITARALKVIDARLRPLDRLRYATPTRQPSTPSSRELIERRATMIPTTLWPSWSMRLIPHTVGGPGGVKAAEFRAALSALLLMPRSASRTYSDALALLDDPVPARFVRGITTRLGKDCLNLLLAALCQLADALDAHASPVDYRRRRELAHRTDLHMDRDAFRRLAARHGLKQWSESAYGAMDSYVRALVTADHLNDLSPEIINRPRARRTELRYRADPHLRGFLHEQAEEHLRRLGIDEPLTWEPPRHWVKGIDWPGIDPGTVSRREFRRQTYRNARLSDVAQRLGISVEHVRLYAEITGLTSTGKKKVGKPLGPRTIAPDKSVLQDLYQKKELSLEQLRAETGCSLEVLKAALVQAGIPVRKPGADPKASHKIDPVWLREQYVDLLRSCEEIALKLGVSQEAIRSRLKRAGAWRAGRYSVPPGFTALTDGMQLSRTVRLAFTGPKCVERVTHLCTLLTAPSLEFAASELAMARSALIMKLRTAERVSGIRIAKWLTPLELTPRGRLLLEEAQGVLARYPATT